jgi:hypothetical protein
MKRKLKISLEKVEGAINLFYAFVNRTRVIAAEGNHPASWEGSVDDGEVTLKIRVLGIDAASYKLSIDLPGTANDQEITFQLEGGYHECKMRI